MCIVFFSISHIPMCLYLHIELISFFSIMVLFLCAFIYSGLIFFCNDYDGSINRYRSVHKSMRGLSHSMQCFISGTKQCCIRLLSDQTFHKTKVSKSAHKFERTKQ